MNNVMMMLQAMPQSTQLMNKASGKTQVLSEDREFSKVLQGLAEKIATEGEVSLQTSEEGSLQDLETMIQQLLELLSSNEGLESKLADWLQTFTESMNISTEELDSMLTGSSELAIDQIGLILTELYRSLVSGKGVSTEAAKGLESLFGGQSGELKGLQGLMEKVLFQLMQKSHQAKQTAGSTTHQAQEKSTVWQQLISSEPIKQTSTETEFVKELQRLARDSQTDKPIMNWAQAITGKLSKQVTTNSLEPVEQFSFLMKHSTPTGAQVKQSLPLQGNSQQMMNQIEQMILSSRFSKPGGVTQLTLQLKPAELGEMILKFVKQDGEMTVKITVMSQMTKDMVDKNLHQLRHLFSPHQVVVERQVETTNETNVADFKEKQEEQEENSQEHQQNTRQLDDDDHEVTFQDFLFAEEV